MSPSSLDIVIRGFLEGDSNQYRVIKSRVNSYVRYQLYDHSECQDIVDEVLQILFENLSAGKFEGDNLRSFNVYVFGITRNRVRRHVTVRKRVMYTSAELDPPDNKTQPSIESVDLARKVISHLGDSCGEILEMKFLRDWSDDEIAQKLGKTKNATSTAIHRCLQKARLLPFIKELL
ncbi:sigma-70 family RNA polymerase sigma factor [bacterium AH-315-F03]|nr:sigma-70 family RNA polymerase sigma factor [bacterium AH-315-F03]